MQIPYFVLLKCFIFLFAWLLLKNCFCEHSSTWLPVYKSKEFSKGFLKSEIADSKGIDTFNFIIKHISTHPDFVPEFLVLFKWSFINSCTTSHYLNDHSFIKSHGSTSLIQVPVLLFFKSVFFLQKPFAYPNKL